MWGKVILGGLRGIHDRAYKHILLSTLQNDPKPKMAVERVPNEMLAVQVLEASSLW